jgi:hypothetical protein
LDVVILDDVDLDVDCWAFCQKIEPINEIIPMNSDLGSYHNKDQADEEENEDSQQFHFSVV